MLATTADGRTISHSFGQSGFIPIGETITWANPSSGNRGMVVATRDGTNQSTGEYCREFQHEVQVGGKGERAYGTACRQPDGSWRIVQ